jgi:hypothetical protein
MAARYMTTLDSRGCSFHTAIVRPAHAAFPICETNMILIPFSSGQNVRTSRVDIAVDLPRALLDPRRESASSAQRHWQSVRVAGVLGCLLATAVVLLAQIK